MAYGISPYQWLNSSKDLQLRGGLVVQLLDLSLHFLNSDQLYSRQHEMWLLNNSHP